MMGYVILNSIFFGFIFYIDFRFGKMISRLSPMEVS